MQCNMKFTRYKSLHFCVSYLLSSLLHLKCYTDGFFMPYLAGVQF